MKYIIPFLVISLAIAYWIMPKEVLVNHQCDLALGSCLIDDAGMQAEIKISPIPLDLNKDFSFQIKYQNKDIELVEAVLIGLSFNHAPVTLPLKKKTPIFYQAKTMFPICTEKKMKWRIHLVTRTSGKKYKTNLDFEVNRD